MVQNDEKTVIFLGAGASYSSPTFALPTMRGFFEEELGAYEELSTFLSWFYHEHDRRDYNLEEVFSYLELSNERTSLWQMYCEEIRRGSREMIIEQLTNYTLQRLSIDELQQEPCPVHKRLFLSLAPQDSIITINYDRIVEHALGRMEDREEYKHIVPKTARYQKLKHLVVTEVGDPPFIIPAIQPRIDEGGHYLKLHGSIDWIRCSSPQCPVHLYYFSLKDSNIPDDYAGRPCAYCGSPMRLAIVPPTPSKRLEDRGKLALLWQLAYRELTAASKWVIIGLSLAPSDFELRWLFKQALENRQSLPIDIHIANPCDRDRENVKRLFCGPTCATFEYKDATHYLDGEHIAE